MIDVRCPSCERAISKKIALYLAEKAKKAGEPVPEFVQRRLEREKRHKMRKPVRLPKEVQESLTKYSHLKQRLVRELGEHRARLLMEE